MKPPPLQPSVLIAGLGNLLLMDDGVGVHVVQAMQHDPPQGTEVVDVGTAILRALSYVEEARHVIIVDAMQAGGPPGSIYEMDGDELAPDEGQLSLHQMGLATAMNFIDPLKRPRMHIIGIEPGQIDYGMELTPPVAAVVPRVCQRVSELAAELQ